MEEGGKEGILTVRWCVCVCVCKVGSRETGRPRLGLLVVEGLFSPPRRDRSKVSF